jgi:hypothetical protein
VTERGRLGLKRRRAASPTGNHPKTRSSAKRPVKMAVDGDNDIEEAVKPVQRGRAKKP